MEHIDHEVRAIEKAFNALAELDDDARKRALEYLVSALGMILSANTIVKGC